MRDVRSKPLGTEPDPLEVPHAFRPEPSQTIDRTNVMREQTPEQLALALLRACSHTEEQAQVDRDVVLDFIFRRQRDQLFHKSQPAMLGSLGVGPCMQNPLKG